MEYGKQLLYTQVLKEALNEVLGDAKGFRELQQQLHNFGDIFFSEEFFGAAASDEGVERRGRLNLLLIDEIDKADHEFESLLLETLSDCCHS